MNTISTPFLVIIGLLSCTVLFTCSQINPEHEKEVLEELLDEFLTNVEDPEIHDRLWAEDLVYTGSAGTRHGKAAIMNSMQKSESDSSEAEGPSYSYENLDIKIFGTTAAITFQLVAAMPTDTDVDTLNYLNSGFFEKRNGQWKAVIWQATKMADSASN